MSRVLLMESILGHLALLAEKHPRKAASPVARKARRAAKLSLMQASSRLHQVAPETAFRKAA